MEQQDAEETQGASPPSFSNSSPSSNNSNHETTPPRAAPVVVVRSWHPEADRILESNSDDEDSDAPPHHHHHHHHGRQKTLFPWPDALQWTAMISNFSTSYNVFNISLAKDILLQVHPLVSLGGNENDDNHHRQEEEEEAWLSLLSSSLLAGMMVGQVVGGALGDAPWLGRMGALRLVMALQIVASLASASVLVLGNHDDHHDEATSHNGGVESLYTQLAVWRFFLGIGAGGVYPLAAVLSAEQQSPPVAAPRHQHDNDNNHNHHDDTKDAHDSTRRVVLTFSVQGLGFWVVPVLTTLLLHCSAISLAWTWRILLGAGSLPGLVLLVLQYYHRPRGPDRNDPNLFLLVAAQSSQDDDEADDAVDVDDSVAESILDSEDDDEDHAIRAARNNNNESPDEDHAAGSVNPVDVVVPPPHGWWAALVHEEDLVTKLLGTALTWFLFDVLFYGNTLFQDVVLEAAFGSKQQAAGANEADALALLKQTALESLAITTIALPGYFVAAMVLGNKVCGIDQTPRFVMMQGFGYMAVLYMVIGLCWKQLRRVPVLLVLLYSLTFFFANYGPNTTTFILPSLVYSPQCKSTLNGLSAACGKFGALVGASLFAPAAETFGDAAVLVMCGIIALVALVDTQLFVKIPIAVSPTTTTTPNGNHNDDDDDDNPYHPAPEGDGQESVPHRIPQEDADDVPRQQEPRTVV